MGKIHSIETFGTVDGPGIRYVIFFQGCPLRCIYCHNPDSWNLNGGFEKSVDEILDDYEKNRDFYKNGGITATGGEPLFQIDFLTKLFVKAKKRGIHTCLDTSGGSFDFKNEKKYKELIDNTDLVLLDIKHSNNILHKRIVGIDLQKPIKFLDFLNRNYVKVIIRHVLVPKLSDDENHFIELGKLLAPYSNIYGVDVLPYHKMGIEKYKELNINYKLENTREANIVEAKNAKSIIIKSYLNEREKYIKKNIKKN